MDTPRITATGAAGKGIALQHEDELPPIRKAQFKDFVTRASKEDWDRLMEEARSTSKTGETIKDKYGFSWSIVRPVAITLGLYQSSSRGSGSAVSDIDAVSDIPVVPFQVESDTVKGKFITRSIQLNPETKERLEKLEAAYPQYNHKSILNQIINDGLSVHGY